MHARSTLTARAPRRTSQAIWTLSPFLQARNTLKLWHQLLNGASLLIWLMTLWHAPPTWARSGSQSWPQAQPDHVFLSLCLNGSKFMPEWWRWKVGACCPCCTVPCVPYIWRICGIRMPPSIYAKYTYTYAYPYTPYTYTVGIPRNMPISMPTSTQ